LLSHRNLTNNAWSTVPRMGIGRGDRLLNVMPLFHTAGCSIAALGAAQRGCPLLMASVSEPNVMLSVIERERVAVMTAVPTMLGAMLEAHTRQPVRGERARRSTCRIAWFTGASVEYPEEHYPFAVHVATSARACTRRPSI
jgi:acyl-CoA synthetase (AMP-forming)/AMP-acid ligase II